MASLLVAVHDTVTTYMKKARDKEKAAKISGDVLEAVRNIIKTHMFSPAQALLYGSINPMTILSREIARINLLLIRRMKPSPTARSPWKMSLSRYMPTEIFSLLDSCIQAHSLGSSRKSTRFTVNIQVSDENKVILLFTTIGNACETVLNEEAVLKTKTLRDGVKCKLDVNDEKPLVIQYSIKRELVRLSLCYGCWNMHGVPQHMSS